MNNTDYTVIMNRIQDDYDWVKSKGYRVLGVFLQGSQNYNLAYEGSDIDTKCIVIPSFTDFLHNKKPVSTTLIREDNSHVDVKDIRLMFDCFLKQNINFLEILFTRYKLINQKYQTLWDTIETHAEEIAHYNNYTAVNCIAGTIFEKNKILCHPYPSVADKIDKYGYDNKQLHHMMRCEEFLTRYILGVPYSACLIPVSPLSLIKVKADYIYTLEEAKDLAASICDNAKYTVNHYMKTHKCEVNTEVKHLMDEILAEVLKSSFLEDFNAEM